MTLGYPCDTLFLILHGTLYFARTFPLGSNNCASSPDCQTGLLSLQYKSMTVFVPAVEWICTAPPPLSVRLGKVNTCLLASFNCQPERFNDSAPALRTTTHSAFNVPAPIMLTISTGISTFGFRVAGGADWLLVTGAS